MADTPVDFPDLIRTRLSLHLEEVSASLAEATDCILACDAPESWDPAHSDPRAAVKAVIRNLQQDAIMARYQADGGDPEEPEDIELAAATIWITDCLATADDRARRAAILSGWHNWPSAAIRSQSEHGRFADRIVRRLYYRLSCYQDALAGAQTWPFELMDPETDLDHGGVEIIG